MCSVRLVLSCFKAKTKIILLITSDVGYWVKWKFRIKLNWRWSKRRRLSTSVTVLRVRQVRHCLNCNIRKLKLFLINIDNILLFQILIIVFIILKNLEYLIIFYGIVRDTSLTWRCSNVIYLNRNVPIQILFLIFFVKNPTQLTQTECVC